MSSEAYFNEVAGQWDQLRATFFSESVREQAIAAADVQPGTLVADIGAGTGFMTEGLARLGVRVIAVDQSGAMLDVLRRKFADVNGIEVHLGRGEAIPLSAGTVDCVFANMYLHHVVEPLRAIGEMVRILKPGGKVVITDLDAHDVEFLRTEHHDRWLGFERSAMHAWLVKSGLQDVAVSSTTESCRSTSTFAPESAEIGIFIASGVKAMDRDQWR